MRSPVIDVLSRLVFGGVGLLLLLLAAALIALGLGEAWGGLRGTETSGVEAILDSIGYIVIAIAVFDVAKYLFEEEVGRDEDKRSAAEARRSLTKFLSTIVIALFLEALVVVLKTSREDVTQLAYPSILLVATVAVLVGLGAYQRFSAEVEQRVGDEDQAQDRKEAARRRGR